MILGLAPLTFALLFGMTALGFLLALAYGLTFKARTEEETWWTFE